MAEAKRLRASLISGFVFLALLAPWAAHAADPQIYAPADGGVALGREVIVDVRGCANTPDDLHAVLDDGFHPHLDWARGPYKDQWIARLKLHHHGHHELALVGKCHAHTHFVSRDSGAADVAWSVARHFMHTNNVPQLAWDWGPGVFLYGLSKLDPAAPQISEYHSYWAAQGVTEPDHADTCAPGLTALQLMRAHDDYTALASAQAVALYLENEPRDWLGGINHMGHWFWSFLFPKSIWVDSLEMTAIFAVQYGQFMGNPSLVDFGASQPGIYASVLQDPATGLFRHAYNTDKNVTIPKSPTFWLRGNGWVLASIVDILDELPADHPKRAELLAILDKLARGLAAFQQPTGLWDSIANLAGATYGETSGTSLYAYAVSKAVHHGWLAPDLLPSAKAAFAGVASRLKRVGPASTDHGLALMFSMPRVSWSTDPGPRWYYKLIPAVSDEAYGVGAFLMAGAELRDERF